MTCAANAGVERVAAGHERGRHAGAGDEQETGGRRSELTCC